MLSCFPGTAAGASAEPKRLVVWEVIDQTGKQEWRNQLIALGIADLLAAELYETGRYVPVEADDEALGMIRDYLKERWMQPAAETIPAAALSAKQLYEKTGCEALAKAVVQKFSTRRISSIGLFAAAKTTVEVAVEITVHEKEGSTMSAMGTGSADTRSLGVLFQIRDDKVYFDETTVGQATRKAVHDAVERLF